MRILLFLIVGLIWMSWASARERRVPWFSWGKPVQQSRPRPSKRVVPTYPTDAFYRLNELTHNTAIAERLIVQVREKNPTQDYRWCIEKAIYDLERDRMAR